jgi:hypothetical protein
LLSIFHYVVAGFAGLFALFPVIHLIFGLAMVSGRLEGASGEERLFGWFFIAIAGTMIVAGLVFAGLLVGAGRSLSRHTRYIFCLVIAGVECMFVPFGTVLGVFTIIVLQRSSVKHLFGTHTPPEPTGRLPGA